MRTKVNPPKRTFEELARISVVNVDKPIGMTSRKVDDRIKNIFGCKKVGHAGTLDENASGVLIVALDEAVKAMPVLMGLDKEYEGVMYLHKDVNREKLEKVVSRHFIGEIIQTPPVKSRVSRKPRKRRVHSFKIIGKDGKDVKFRVKVEAGTYIRKLIHDVGEKLGIGAHLKELRRTKVGHFFIKDSNSLEDIAKANKKRLKKFLIPIESALPHVKKIHVVEEAIPRIRNGAPVFRSDVKRIQTGIMSGEIVGIFSPNNKLVALGVSKMKVDGMIRRRKGVMARTDRIFKS